MKFASAIHWIRSSALGSHLLVPIVALRWTPAAATTPPLSTRLRRTIFAYEWALVKAPGLLRSHPQMPALSLFVRRTSPPSARSLAPVMAHLSRNLAQRATVPPLAARTTRLSKKAQRKTSAPVLAALRTRPPRLHPLGTTVPSFASRAESPRRTQLHKPDALILAARRLSVSRNLLLRSAAPDLAIPKTSLSKTMTPGAFIRTLAIRNLSPLLNFQLVSVQDLAAEKLRTRSPKSPPRPPLLALATSHRSRIF